MKDSVAKIIEKLGLKPHPEGGFFAETFRSPLQITLPDGRIRSASTAIHFLLPVGTFSALHRVASDEVWHYYDGEPLELTTITPEGELKTIVLGHDLAANQIPQWVVPAGVWQGARPLQSDNAGYTFVGCTVAPGFDFADFEMPDRKKLLQLFPQHTSIICELTR